MPYSTAPDTYAGTYNSAGSPTRNAVAVTPADSDLVTYAVALYIGVSGDLAVIPINGANTDTPLVFKNVPVGWFPVQVRRVCSTGSGTTATQIIAVW